MELFSEENATAVVQARHQGCTDERLKQIMDVVIRHLHAAVKELELTPQEWEQAIGFLTGTGHLCSDTRQEFILLSDTLGVSMLVDAINHRRGGPATENTVLGPFHRKGVELLPMGASIVRSGELDPPLFVSGKVTDTNGKPIEGATLDVWQASPDGLYDVQDPNQAPFNLRGLFQTGADGRFWFRSAKPAPYPIPYDGTVGKMLERLGRHPYRPAHIHFIVAAPGFETVTTHLFVAGDPYLDSDAVFGVKESLVVEFHHRDDPEAARKVDLPSPFWEAAHDFVLVPARGGRDA
ncbi:MAG: intradiol ring-cleavage dioxygenase [Aquisalimonadaceae bacterium]